MDRAPNDIHGEVVSLKEFVLTLLAEREARFAQQVAALEATAKASLAAASSAESKAEATIAKQFAGVNELRGVVEDQQKTLARKEEVSMRFDALEARVDEAAAQLRATKMTIIVVSGLVTTAAALWAIFGNLSAPR